MKKKIFLVACLVLVLACALVVPFAFASAEVENVYDLQLDTLQLTDEIVYNQLYRNNNDIYYEDTITYSGSYSTTTFDTLFNSMQRDHLYLLHMRLIDVSSNNTFSIRFSMNYSNYVSFSLISLDGNRPIYNDACAIITPYYAGMSIPNLVTPILTSSSKLLMFGGLSNGQDVSFKVAINFIDLGVAFANYTFTNSLKSDILKVFSQGFTNYVSTENTTIGALTNIYKNNYYSGYLSGYSNGYDSGYIDGFSVSNTDAYNQGVKDTLGSISYDLALSDFYNNSFGFASVDTNLNTKLIRNVPYTINGQEIFGLNAYNVSWKDNGASYTSNLALMTAIGFNINHVIPIGSTLTIKFQGYSLANDYSDTSPTNIFHNVYLATFNGTSFSTFLDLGSGLMNVTEYRTFTVSAPAEAQQLYLVSNGSITCTYLDINVQYTNSDVLVDSIYKSGQDSVYKLYSVGGVNYQQIYQAGWQAGHEAPQYDFKYLITAAIDTPVQAFTNLFDFDILGVNMKTFYLSIFTCCVIFVIIKMVI